MRLDIAPLEPTSERGFRILHDARAEALEQKVVQAMLAAGGLASDNGWLVQVSLASRKAGIGTFTDENAREQEWSQSPRLIGATRGKQQHVLGLVLTADEGRQRRTVQVTARSDDEMIMDVLLDEMVRAAVQAAFEGHQDATGN